MITKVQVKACLEQLGSFANAMLATVYHRMQKIAVWPIPKYTRGGLYSQVAVVGVSLFLLEWYRPVPGVAIGVLALVAVLVAIRAEYNFPRGEQIGWIVIAGLLFIVEVRSIYRDRDEFAQHQADIRRQENSHHEQQMTKMDELRKTNNSQLQVSQALQDQSSYRAVLSTAREDLRTRSLRLARNMLNFVLDRQVRDPFSGTYPNFYMVGTTGNAKNQEGMPAYGKETIFLFAHRFDTALKDVRDEFSVYGLGEWTMLNALAQESPEAIGGNPYAALRQVADDIRKMALLIPTDSLYKDTSNERLADMALEEADKIDQMTAKTKNELFNKPKELWNGVRSFFYFDFKDCCLNQVEYLRAELIKRLGPAAHDTEEMRMFNGPRIGITEIEENPMSSFVAVSAYMPKFRILAEKLKAKAQKR